MILYFRDIDNSRNPMVLTKDRIERAATENQFMNGKIKAIEVRIDVHLVLKRHSDDLRIVVPFYAEQGSI